MAQNQQNLIKKTIEKLKIAVLNNLDISQETLVLEALMFSERFFKRSVMNPSFDISE